MRVIAGRVREIRERKLLTQTEIADLTGMSEATINRIERGLQQPRISSIRKLAAVLEVDPEEIIDWTATEPETGKAAA